MQYDYKIVVSDKGQIYLIYALPLEEEKDEQASIQPELKHTSDHERIKINELKCVGLKDTGLFQSKEKAVLIKDTIFLKGTKGLLRISIKNDVFKYVDFDEEK